MRTNPEKKASTNVLLRMPRALAKQVSDAAADQGVSQNTFICTILADAVVKLGFPVIPE